MRVPLSWLNDFIDVPDDLDALSSTCDMAGLEVEKILHLGESWDHILVGAITAIEPIPETHLHAVDVDIGNGEIKKSVCGAPNVSVDNIGSRVATAVEGARLTVTDKDGASTEITVSPRKMRGFPAEAVLCSEKELGISEEHGGILFLAEDATPGTPLVDLLGDHIFEFDLTPDLGRCFSVFGTAREIAALHRIPLRREALALADMGDAGGGSVPVTIETPELCNRYLGAVIRNVTVGASPDWMQRRLVGAGLRPINNIVDISNYVLLEMGQPLHFFDLARLQGPAITVRTARTDEAIDALNGENYKLPESALVIADEGGPVAIAGVIGGAESAVDEETRDVLLEAAHFHNHRVRRTAAAIKLRTDAAERFIKDVDPEWTFDAMCRAVHLLLTLCPDAQLEGYQDAYPIPAEKTTLTITEADVTRLLGVEIPEADIQDMLERFDFSLEAADGGLRATAPTYRKDVSCVADLIEEVARVQGMNQIPPATMGKAYLNQSSYDASMADAQDEVAAVLTGQGFFEAINYSIVDDTWNTFGAHAGGEMGETIRLANPLHVDKTSLRETLIPGLLKNVGDNFRFQKGVHLFELGRSYTELPEGNQEQELVSLVATGARRSPFWGENDPGTAVGTTLSLFDLKGVISGLCERLGVTQIEYSPMASDALTAGQAMSMQLNGESIGFLGDVTTQWAERFDIEDQRVLCAEVRLRPLVEARKATALSFQRLTTQPAVFRDISILVSENTAVGAILDTAREAAGDLLHDLQLFDRYRGEGIPDGSHSLAISMTFQHAERTLTAEEVDASVQAVVDALAEQHTASLR